MLYHPDVVIYLWLFPVFFLLLLPVVTAILGLSFKLTRLYLFPEELPDKDKRKYPRFVSSEDTFAEITQGDTTCTGLVCNISRLGISLKNLPDTFSDEIDKLTVVINEYGVHFNLLVKPKWVLLTDSGRQIGAEIDVASSDWGQFLLLKEKNSAF